MFANGYVSTLLGITAMLYLVQCKLQPVGGQQSVLSADDSVKIAAHYLGDARCRAYLSGLGHSEEKIAQVISAHAKFDSHKLHGSNGELITKQFKEIRNKPKAKLSGDRFLGRDSNAPFEMEKIEANCRRLVLSVDSHVLPTLTVTHGFVPQDQQQRLQQDFGDQGFGNLNCSDNWCVFSGITGTGGSTRYFALLEPAVAHSHIQLAVNHYPKNNREQVNIATIELENIRFADERRYQDHSVSLALDEQQTCEQDDCPHYISQNYVRELYVSYRGGSNLQQLPNGTQVKISIQVPDDGHTSSRWLVADRLIELHSNDPQRRLARFSVKNICNQLQIGNCGEQQENLAARLVQHRAELSFSFYQQNPQTLFHTQHLPLTNELLDAMLKRQGTRNITHKQQGWTVEFGFDNLYNKQLQLYLARSQGNTMPQQIHLEATTGCGKSNIANKDYSLQWHGNADGNYTLLNIDAEKLVKHYRGQKCLQNSVTRHTPQQFIKLLAPKLVFHASEFRQNHPRQPTGLYTVWSYQLTEADIDNWFSARGGVTLPQQVTQSTNPNTEDVPPLLVGFQDRR